MNYLKIKFDKSGVTLTRLAELSNCSISHIHRVIEKNERKLSYKIAKRIYKALNFNNSINCFLASHDIKVNYNVDNLRRGNIDLIGRFLANEFNSEDNNMAEKDKKELADKIIKSFKIMEVVYFKP